MTPRRSLVDPTDLGCLCRDCGHRYRVDLGVPDDVWARIGMPAGGGLLCGSCLMRRVERLAQDAQGFGYLIVGEASVP